MEGQTDGQTDRRISQNSPLCPTGRHVEADFSAASNRCADVDCDIPTCDDGLELVYGLSCCPECRSKSRKNIVAKASIIAHYENALFHRKMMLHNKNLAMGLL